MEEIQFSEIKTTYYFGGKTCLTPSWNNYDAVCPTAKLYFVIDGEIYISVAGKIYLLKKGDACLIPPNEKHSFYLTEKNHAEKFWFHFDVSQGGNFFTRINFNYVTKIDKYNEVYSLFEKIGKYEKSNDVVDKLIITGAVSTIVALFLKDANAKKTGGDADEIDKIVSFIEENPADTHNLQELAEKAHLSPNYFIRKFKERTGFTPIQYSTFIKIQRAKSLLENSMKNVFQIMNEVGFDDPAYFSKLFKLHTGCSPKRFRQIYGKQKDDYNY